MKRSRRITAVVAATVAVPALLGLASCDTRFGAPLARPEDPVVLKGSALPSLIGTAPSRVVAFAYNGSEWTQVPVQVDEKDLVNPATILNRATPASLPNGGGEYRIPVYTQPPAAAPGYTWTDVYTPTDSNPTLDADDEVSFLVNDSGKQAPAGANPSGVTTSTRKQVTLTDPDDATKAGYVYLYASTTLTGGGAGTSGVQYTFSLDAGAYKATYGMGTGSRSPNNKRGPNPEHSTIVTPTYTQTYNDRWANDGLTIKSGSSSRADLLDRSPYIVPNLACGRTEDTYDDVVMSSPYSGAFVANISGPVRAIRSHMGANSFTYLVTTDVFYPQREDTVIELRGHAGLPAFATYDDITTNLAGMRYDDPANVGLAIDGAADSFTPVVKSGDLSSMPDAWSMVSGPAGSLVTTRALDTDIADVRATSYYLDAAGTRICTGDASSWGVNGVNLTRAAGAFPNTDPTLGAANSFTSTRWRYFKAPGLGRSSAAKLAVQAQDPLLVSVS